MSCHRCFTAWLLALVVSHPPYAIPDHGLIARGGKLACLLPGLLLGLLPGLLLGQLILTDPDPVQPCLVMSSNALCCMGMYILACLMCVSPLPLRLATQRLPLRLTASMPTPLESILTMPWKPTKVWKGCLRNAMASQTR